MSLDSLEPSSQLQTANKENIIHIGLGAFHRGHQAFLFNALNAISKDKQWNICGINLFNDGSNIAEKLRQQGFSYNVIERTDDDNIVTNIRSITDAMQLQNCGLDAILQIIAEPQIEIITFTITEKGYCTTAGGKTLDLQNPIIKEDLVNLGQPKSVPAILYKALKLRQSLNRPPITLLSCDNMPENGHALKNALLGFVEQVDPEFESYIDKNVTFPCSMVDRIVPAVNEESLEIAEEILGKKDACVILTEPFIQWVVEDSFAQPRPSIEKIDGVSVVKDVIPFEDMKLRMLNGSHSFLAYLGSLAGYAHISDCMADPKFKEATYQLMMTEQAPTLSVEGVDLDKYAKQLIHRFENSALKHQTAQIAMDGSQKIPQRFLASLQTLQERNQPHPLLTLGLAGWMNYVSQNSEALKDPLQSLLHKVVQSTTDGNERVLGFLKLTEIFPKELSSNQDFVNDLTQRYLLIKKQGAKAAVSQTVRG